MALVSHYSPTRTRAEVEHRIRRCVGPAGAGRCYWPDSSAWSPPPRTRPAPPPCAATAAIDPIAGAAVRRQVGGER